MNTGMQKYNKSLTRSLFMDFHVFLKVTRSNCSYTTNRTNEFLLLTFSVVFVINAFGKKKLATKFTSEGIGWRKSLLNHLRIRSVISWLHSGRLARWLLNICRVTISTASRNTTICCQSVLHVWCWISYNKKKKDLGWAFHSVVEHVIDVVTLQQCQFVKMPHGVNHSTD